MSNELKNVKFRELFPHITNIILSDNNELIRLFNETRDMFFFDSLKLDNIEKREIYREYLLKNPYEVTKKYIDKNKDDRELLVHAVKCHPSKYEMLPENLKNDDEVIKIICKDYKHAKEVLSSNHLDKYIDFWLYSNADKINYTELKELNDEQLNKVMELITENKKIIGAYDAIGFRVKKGLELVIKRDFDYVIRTIDIKKLKNYYEKNENIYMDNYLNRWIDNLSIKRFQNTDAKIIDLIKSKEELNKKLVNNFNYELSMLIANKNIDYDTFKKTYEHCKNEINSGKIDYEKANEILNLVKSRLPVEILKEKRLPKQHLMQYLEEIELTEKISKNDNVVKKHKI